LLVPGRALNAPAGAAVSSGWLGQRRAPLTAPWVAAPLLALALALAYLAWAPPSADLAAATYRAGIFAHSGWTIWDDGWYAGHNLLAYSLLAPALGTWLGLRTLLAICAVVAAACFGVLAQRAFLRPGAALASSLAFAFGYCAELPSGRVPYDLGVALGLAALCALAWSQEGHGRGRFALALALALATCAASPVAGTFLALAGAAVALVALAGGAAERRRSLARRAFALALASLAPVVLLAIAFPEGGREPFAAGAFWPELAAACALAALIPRGGLTWRAWLVLRLGAALYALALALSFAIGSPLGGNVVRLGALFGAPIAVGALWGTGEVAIARRRLPWWAVLLALSPVLLYWQLATAIDDQVALAGDPAVNASFYAPLRAQLERLAAGGPLRVEVPMTGAHWESAYLPGGRISLARGWERQLDTRDAALFYRPGLGAAAYRVWLRQDAVGYVALPHARLDAAGRAEAAVIRSRPSYLHEIWHSPSWRLFAVQGATPLAQPPAQMTALAGQGFTLRVPRAGSYRVALRFSPYWAVSGGDGCVQEAPGGWTLVRAPGPERLVASIEFSLGRIFEHGPRCR